MKKPVLVIIKPDAISRELVGEVFKKFAETKLKIVALRVVKPSKKQVEEHYKHLRKELFFDNLVLHLMGEFHGVKELIIIVYYGEDAIEKCRKLAGATDPREAKPESIRGSFGKVTKKGVYENVVHVSASDEEAEHEIKLWFEPKDILEKLYPVNIENVNNYKKKVWL